MFTVFNEKEDEIEGHRGVSSLQVRKNTDNVVGRKKHFYSFECNVQGSGGNVHMERP